MTLSFEVALPIGAIAFYLYDSATLLYGNEVIFVRRRSGWQTDGGVDFFIFGKRFCMPAALRPWVPLWRVVWRENDTRAPAASDWPSAVFLKMLYPLQVIGTALLILLVLVLPTVSIAWGTGWLLVAVFASFYAVILAALLYVHSKRKTLNLDGSSFWLLALDLLACPPFGVNLVRKVTLHQGMAGNPIEFAKSRFEPGAYGHFVALVHARLDEFLSREPAGSRYALDLLELRDQLGERQA